jgi:hypothetical protein
MKRILSLIVSLGLVFSAYGHSINDYVMAATTGTGSDETLLRMLSEDGGLNNLAIVEAALLAKRGFEYQDVIAMPFNVKQQILQESIAPGSPLTVDQGLGAFAAGGASEGDSLGGVLPATIYEPATVAYASSLPADWGVAITDANNLAELEAFLFTQPSIYKDDYAALTAATLGEKIYQLQRINVALLPEIFEVVETVVVPAPEPVVVPAPASAAGGAAAERIIAYLRDKLDGAQQDNLRTYSDADLVNYTDMIDQGKTPMAVKMLLTSMLAAPNPTSVAAAPAPAPAVGGASGMSGAFAQITGGKFSLKPVKKPSAATVSTPAVPAPADPVPTPAVPAATPAVGAKPNMPVGLLAEIAGGVAALKPADGVFTRT